jgi:hypothetical protein
MTLIFRNFKQTQIDDTNRFDSNFSGFKFYRKAAALSEAYASVSADPIQWKFIDTNLTNGTEYNYGITKVYGNVFESTYTDKITITPQRFTHRQEVIITNSVVAFSQNEQITFYVDYNKQYKASELLNEIVTISAIQDPLEPRRYIVNVVVKDVLDNQVSVAARRLNPVTGQSF